MPIEKIGSYAIESAAGRMESQLIGRTGQAGRAESLRELGEPGHAGAVSFVDVLKDKIDSVNEMQVQADRAAKELTAGRNKNIHETMLLMEQADISFRLISQIRNKIVEAYKEIMRMQV